MGGKIGQGLITVEAGRRWTKNIRGSVTLFTPALYLKASIIQSKKENKCYHLQVPTQGFLELHCLIQEALATCVYLHLNSLQCNKLKCQFLSHLSHISSAPWPHVARGSRTGQCGYRMFPTSRKVLLDSSGLDTVQP